MRVLLTGDSIIARHEGLTQPRLNVVLMKKIPDLQLMNTAVSGINSGAFLARLNELIFKAPKCDILVILLGTNDLAIHKQVPLKQFHRNLEGIVSAVICRYWPKRLILISPPAVDESRQHVRSNKLVQRYSQVVEQVAREYHCHFLNLARAMLKHGQLKNLCRGMKNDGLHVGAAGYRLLGSLLAAQLKSLNLTHDGPQQANK